MNSECILCQLNSIKRHLKTVDVDESTRLDIIRDFLDFLSKADKKSTNPELAAQLNRLISAHHPDKEIYKKEKREFNDLMLSLFDKYLKIAISSENPEKTAMKLAIAGNIIDFGPDHTFDAEETINSVLKSDLKIDDSDELFRNLKQAKNILYLADNAGEFVMDKLFIKILNNSGLTVAVRGKPVLNDVVMADAEYIGIDKVASIIENGSDVPSTVPALCSDEFNQEFENADVIISKGQGNLEGLLNYRDKNIFFLFTVKCDAIANLTNTNKGDFVVMHARRLPDCSQSPCL